MDLSPQAVASASFAIVKKGFDPDEVRAFLGQVATSLESSNQQAAAMEARARAAVAKVQELSQAASATPPSTPRPAVAEAPAAKVDDATTISRALVLAQRAADQALAEAEAEAAQTRAEATAEAARIVEQARAEAAAHLDQVRNDARHARDSELAQAEEAVQALLARRDFLLGDVDQLEQHVQAQRERVRDAALALHELVERVPAGLGDLRRPLLSASGGTEAGQTAAASAPADRSDPVPSARAGLKVDLASGWRAEDDASAEASDGHGTDAAEEPAVEPTPVATDDPTPVEGLAGGAAGGGGGAAQAQFDLRSSTNELRIGGHDL